MTIPSHVVLISVLYRGTTERPLSYAPEVEDHHCNNSHHHHSNEQKSYNNGHHDSRHRGGSRARGSCRSLCTGREDGGGKRGGWQEEGQGLLPDRY